jgi:hypothetical protein
MKHRIGPVSCTCQQDLYASIFLSALHAALRRMGGGPNPSPVGAETLPSAPEQGFLLPDRSRRTSSALGSDSGTISSRDLPPALPDLRAAVRLSGPAVIRPIGDWSGLRPRITALNRPIDAELC